MVESFVDNGGSAGIDLLTLESGTVIAIVDVDNLLSTITDIDTNSIINGVVL